jgi:preprotein translocase subunit YajC
LSIPESLADVATFVAQATQATGATTQQTAPVPTWVQLFRSVGSMLPIFLLIIVFFWMTSRARRKQEREKQDMLGAMKRGDRVQTIGGILGNVVEVREDRILLKVDEGNNTKVWFARSAIHRVLGDEAEAK